MPKSVEYPHGAVTYVFTDVENSAGLTRRLEGLIGQGYYEQDLRDPYRKRLGDKAEQHWGVLIHQVGDGNLFVFQEVDDALAFAVSVQQSLLDSPIRHEHESTPFKIRIRIGVHRAR